MTEASSDTGLQLSRIDAPYFQAPAQPDDRRFRLGLGVAIVVHALFLVSFSAQGVRQIGDPGGDKDAIGVDFISEAELRRLGTVGDRAAGPTTPQTPPVQQSATPVAQPPEPQPTATPPEPVSPEPQQPQKPAELAAAAGPKSLPPPEPEPPLKIEDNVDVLPPRQQPPKPAPEAKPEPPRPESHPPRPTKQPPIRTSRLDLSIPPSVLSGPSGGGGAGIERPAGITRSGENDAFARGVISALQRNMPQLREARGQVTVRITLDRDGNLVSTQVVRPSQVAGLDQSVVFSTRQSSFPFPPRNARAADLVFLVTYIYR